MKLFHNHAMSMAHVKGKLLLFESSLTRSEASVTKLLVISIQQISSHLIQHLGLPICKTEHWYLNSNLRTPGEKMQMHLSSK